MESAYDPERGAEMDQTTKNMLMIFGAPVIVGLIIRFLVGKRKKGTCFRL